MWVGVATSEECCTDGSELWIYYACVLGVKRYMYSYWTVWYAVHGAYFGTHCETEQNINRLL